MHEMVAWARHASVGNTRLTEECFARHKCILPDTDTQWYDPNLMPPVSMYVGNRDELVDGAKLIERFEKIERDVIVLRSQVDEYEHLDCLWSMDAIDRVGKHIREDIWVTVQAEDVIVPEECDVYDKGSKVRKQEDTNIE